MTQKILTITVGALFRGRFRAVLKTAKFYGAVSDYEEIKGFLSSRFLIRDPNSIVVDELERMIASENP